jgi:hypothetical protein
MITLQKPHNDFRDAVKAAYEALATSDAPDVVRDAVIAKLFATHQKRLDTLLAVGLQFEPALLTISEPHTQRVLTKLYDDFTELWTIGWEELEQAAGGKLGNTHRSDEQLDKVAMHRGTLASCVRQYLLNAPPLEFNTNSRRGGQE